MKIKFFNPIHYFVLSVLLLMPATLVWGQENIRTIEKNFPLSDQGSVEIQNRYGSISLEHWDREEVAFLVTITAEGKDSDVLDQIDIDFQVLQDEVRAKTEIDNTRNSWWNPFKQNNQNFSINYRVQLPKTAKVTLDNAYGNIYWEETDGPTAIKCAYGRIEIGVLNHSSNRITLKYAPNSAIDFIAGGSIQADYSGIRVNEAGAIKLTADYSKSRFDRIQQLDFEADYGSIRADEIGRITGNADYLSLKIGTLTKGLDLSMDYGGLGIENIQASTEEIAIVSDYTGIRLNADADWDFAFTVETQYAGFKTDFPLEYRRKIIETTDQFFQGTHKEGKNTLTIKADYGSIKLYQN